MLASLRHRGPDEFGYYFDDVIAMGTARLSILDLRHGQQPIGDAARRYWICFNGEIYNYRELRVELAQHGCTFGTNSDTEVLLNAWMVWGPAALPKLNGAFAFCIYDREERSIVLARDRFGKRPLFYIEEGHHLLFASEMKAFLAYERFRFEFDFAQVASILRTWTPIAEQSGFKGVKQLPAASYMRVTERSMQIVTYAPLDIGRPQTQVSQAEAASLIYQVLSESVRLRLRSDVEVGIYLSGGIDSAILAQLVSEQRSGSTRSFSVEFEDDEFDESADQQLIAQHLGMDHASIRIGSRDIVEAFPQALWHAEVPVFRTAFVPMFLLSKWVSHCGIKVVLTGEGADEAFLGYDIFKETMLREAWAGMDEAARQSQLARLYPYLRHFNADNRTSLHAFFDRFARKAGETEFLSHEVRFHNSSLSRRLLTGKFDDLHSLSGLVRAAGTRYSALTNVQKAQWLEFNTLLGGYLLSTQGDRMSLAHGVENRCPFLDWKVVCAGLTTNLKFDDGFNEKYLLKRAFGQVLPPQVIRKHKQPYRAPDARAFLDARPDYLELIRSPAELNKISGLDVKFCGAFVEKTLAKPHEAISQAENQTFVFLLSLAVLHEQFVARRAPPSGDIDSLLVRRIDGRARI